VAGCGRLVAMQEERDARKHCRKHLPSDQNTRSALASKFTKQL
jgi:hypothetical protein